MSPCKGDNLLRRGSLSFEVKCPGRTVCFEVKCPGDSLLRSNLPPGHFTSGGKLLRDRPSANKHKTFTADCVHWMYSSSSSSAISESERPLRVHIRSSISSVVELARFLVNHGGLLNLQHVPPPSQTWPSQSGAFG